MAARADLPSQIAEELRRRIAADELRPGARLPSEPSLAIELGVSRPTLREALRLMANEGWLVRKHGSGTFVAERMPVHNSLEINFGVTELIHSAGRQPSTSAVAAWSEPASVSIAAALEIAGGERVDVIERVRLADGEAVVHSLDYVATSLGLFGVMAQLGDGSLYDALVAKGMAVARGEVVIDAVAAPAAICRALGLRRAAPVLRLDQIDYDRSGRPVVFSIEHHRPEAFEVRVSRRGPAD